MNTHSLVPLSILPGCLLILTPLSIADTIVALDDAPHLGAAIALAAGGDTVVIQTTFDQNFTGAGITLDKPLTIIGDPICNIEVSGNGSGLLLAGPGSGEVVLSGVSIHYGTTDNDGRPTLYGGGFESLHLLDCSIKGGAGGASSRGGFPTDQETFDACPSDLSTWPGKGGMVFSQRMCTHGTPAWRAPMAPYGCLTPREPVMSVPS